jgi:hypothetical protein
LVRANLVTIYTTVWSKVHAVSAYGVLSDHCHRAQAGHVEDFFGMRGMVRYATYAMFSGVRLTMTSSLNLPCWKHI